MTMRRAIGIGMLLVLAGCPKKSDDGRSEAGAAPSTSASAAADAGDASTAPATATFKGKYTVAAGTMYVPDAKDWSSVKFKNDDSKLLGDGELSLTIDPAGRVTGTSEGGPLGAAVIEGMREGESLAAAVRRKDPSDDGLTGTLQGKVAGDKVDGTMQLAEFNAAVVRTATFSVTKK